MHGNRGMPVTGYVVVVDLSGGTRTRASSAVGIRVAAEQVEGCGVVQHQLLQSLHLLAGCCAHQQALAAARDLHAPPSN